MSHARVVVIGAGLSGLTAAARLVSAGRDVVVIEAGARAGGQIHTWRDGEFVVELGAEGFVARSRAVPALCARLGIQSALVDQLTTDTYEVVGTRLVLLPPGEAATRLGFQVPQADLGQGIRSLARGMGQVIDALMAHVGPQRVRLATGATAVRRGAPGSLVVDVSDGASESCDAVVLAVPARLAAALVAPLSLRQTAPLAAAPLVSNVSVNLLYRRAQFERYPDGSGVLFPSSFADVGLRALSLVEHKFAGRVPEPHALLRVFFRPVGDALTAWTDARFADEAAHAIARVLSVTGAPLRTWVSRWRDALPVFTPGYKAEVAAADQALQALAVHVTGSAFHGAGIDAAVTSADLVAARLV